MFSCTENDDGTWSKLPFTMAKPAQKQAQDSRCSLHIPE